MIQFEWYKGYIGNIGSLFVKLFKKRSFYLVKYFGENMFVQYWYIFGIVWNDSGC